MFALLGIFAWAERAKGARPLSLGIAPDFTLITFDGETIALSQLHGKAVAVNFLASWYAPCRDEWPLLQHAWEEYRKRGLVVVGVDYVDPGDAVSNFISEFKQTNLNGPDLSIRISQLYRITGVPEMQFITRDGKILSGMVADGPHMQIKSVRSMGKRCKSVSNVC